MMITSLRRSEGPDTAVPSQDWRAQGRQPTLACLRVIGLPPMPRLTETAVGAVVAGTGRQGWENLICPAPHSKSLGQI